MKAKRRFSKMLALLCSVVLLVSCLGMYVSAADTPKVASETEYTTVLGVDDFLGGATEKTWTGASELLTAGNGTLEGVLLDGIFNIKRYSSIAIGSQTGWRLMLGVNNAEYFYYQFANAKGIVTGGEAKTFSPTDLGCNYNGGDMRIKIGFSCVYTDEAAGIADVTMKIQLGTYLDEQVLTITGVPMAQFTRTIYVNGANSAVAMKAASDEPTVLGIEDFIGGASEKTWSGTNSELITAGEGTLDNVVIEGIFNISRYSNIAFGSQAGCRLMIGVHNDYSFYYQFANSSGLMAGGERVTFDKNALGIEYAGQDVPIRISFTFSKQNYLKDTANVTVKIKVADYLDEQVLNLEGIVMSQMARAMFVNPNTGAITLKPAQEETETVLGISDFIGGATEKSWTGSNSELITAGEGTLDNVTIEGIFNIARYSNISIGSQAGCRLMIGVNNPEKFYYQFANAQGIMAGGEAVAFSPTDLGCYYNGQDVPIKVSFEFSKQNYVTGTANVTIKLQIGEYLDEQVMNLQGVVMSQMARAMFVNPSTAAVTLKEKPAEAAKTYTVLSVKDFLEADSQTCAGSDRLTLTAGEGTLDGVAIDGIYNLSRYSSILFGSIDKNRLQIGVNNGHVFYYQYCNAAGVVTSEVFDTSYHSKDLRIKVCFDFVKKNVITGVADVVIRLAIGDSIQREITVEDVPVAQLARTLIVNPNTGSITVKTVEEYYEAGTGYELSGEGYLVNEEAMGNTLLNISGDYFVRSIQDDLYAKYVIVYKAGDVRTDGEVDLGDFMAMLKTTRGDKELTSKAALKGADADGSGTIDAADCDAIRNILIH